jgi:hypothetical protein
MLARWKHIATGQEMEDPPGLNWRVRLTGLRGNYPGRGETFKQLRIAESSQAVRTKLGRWQWLGNTAIEFLAKVFDGTGQAMP